MADADEVFRARFATRPGTRYVALVPNPRGLDRALVCDVNDIALFVAATESFSRANINRSIEQSLDDAPAGHRGRPPGRRARARLHLGRLRLPVRGPVSVRSQVRAVAEPLFDLGVEEVVLGDTIGVATPADVGPLMDALLELAPLERWGMHFHDTRGMALANVLASLDHRPGQVRQLGRRTWRLSVRRARRGWQPGDRRPALPARRTGRRSTAWISTGSCRRRATSSSAVGHPLTSKVFQAGGRLTTIPAPR